MLGRFRLLVRPETVLRWHRDLLARRHVSRSRPKRPGRPRTVRSIRLLVLRLARENPCWGYRRIHGELLVLGIKVAASTMWEILHRPGSTRQVGALLACDFFETVTLGGTRLYVLAVIEHASRRIRILGATPHPAASWVVQAAKNLVMDLEDVGSQARFLIRDRDGKFPGLFDAVLKDAGIDIVLSGVQMPRMNAVMRPAWSPRASIPSTAPGTCAIPSTPTPCSADWSRTIPVPSSKPGTRTGRHTGPRVRARARRARRRADLLRHDHQPPTASPCRSRADSPRSTTAKDQGTS